MRILLLLFFITACSVGPEYEPQRIKVPKDWGIISEKGIREKKEFEIGRWWEKLKDPVLSKLIDSAIKGNLDLKVALSRLREARALRLIEKSKLFPWIDSSAAYTRKRHPETGKTSELYSIDIDASWEADIFGGIRRSIEEAEARLFAEMENVKDVLVSLVSEVAINYVELRTYQARLKALKANIKAQEGIYKLNLSRFKAGLIDELAVAQSRYILESTRAKVPYLEEQIEKVKNRIAVLLGKMPAELEKELFTPRPIPRPPVEIVIGIPAYVLRNRPDVRRAEMEFAAATYAVGKAKADLYPKVDLSGSIGLEAIEKGDLFRWARRTWSLGIRITWKIFHANQLRLTVNVYSERQKQAFFKFKNTVLKAIEEVRSAIIAYVQEKKREKALEKALASAKRTYKLALDRYKAGLIDFTDVLDAEKAVQTLEDQLAESRGKVVLNLIRLYKAIGGGWQSFSLKT